MLYWPLPQFPFNYVGSYKRHCRINNFNIARDRWPSTEVQTPRLVRSPILTTMTLTALKDCHERHGSGSIKKIWQKYKGPELHSIALLYLGWDFFQSLQHICPLMQLLKQSSSLVFMLVTFMNKLELFEPSQTKNIEGTCKQSYLHYLPLTFANMWSVNNADQTRTIGHIPS